MRPLPFREIHLDFHTAGMIPDIGIDFDPGEFVQTLQLAHVNSITVFAKCHHGYSYYPTKIGTVHPHLKRPDLLGEMIEACHAAGIRVPIYTTLVWDELAWETHPEWRHITPDGGLGGPAGTPLKPGWKNLCMNTSYADYVINQMEEILEMYDVDGLFIDIVRYGEHPCVCATCLSQMQAEGVDPTNSEQLRAFTRRAERQFLQRSSAAIRAKNPEASIFYNARLNIDWNPALGNRPEVQDFTHFEIESLPGGFWGYDHFPLSVRYFQTFGLPLLAMTGRFHTMWGDFGGLRNRAALEFECFQALAHGSVISIGDQLHPRGRLHPAVYERIGEVYAEVERREQWVTGSKPLPDIGVLVATTGVSSHEGEFNEADRGVLHVLEQLKHQFEYLDAGCDLSAYSLVILADEVPVNAELADKLRAYLAGGGKLLISGASGLNAESGDFYLAEEMGVHYEGPAAYAPDYLVLGPELGSGIEDIDQTCELPGTRVSVGPGVEVLAVSGQPYFNRTWDHFCSHQYTPMSHVSEEAVIVQQGNVIYCARPLFTEYALTARRMHKLVLGNCIERLLALRVAEHNLPTTAIVTVRQQAADLVVHLLHYVHQRRGKILDVIEDVLPLYDLSFGIRTDAGPTAVLLQPEGQALAWEWDGNLARFTVPKLEGYQIVVLKNALEIGA
ncbi:MAG: alpha-L-fucosidase [Caldilineales bacterium]|nr:alpha-L-fucosidase [Caldilineales bacterium]